MVFPHLPQRHIAVVALSAENQRCPPPLTHTPTSGFSMLHVELPHFLHLHVPIKTSLLQYFA
jgi:hypothetical protein